MKLIWNDDLFIQNDKTSSYQLDSSRTTDSISNISTKEEKSKFNEKLISNFSSLRQKDKVNENDTTNFSKKLSNEKILESDNIINFKKYLSFFLSFIYFILFLTNMPKIPVKIGEEEKMDLLLQNSKNKHTNILINDFNFFCNKSNSTNNNCEIKGILLEFVYNKIFILRWSIGFFYFILKCIFFIYLNNKNNNNEKVFVENIMIWIQKISTLIFPLILFYFDLQNKISYTEIKSEQIYNKSISFIMMKEREFSMIDYIEGLIPTLFTFLISIDYVYLKKIINNMFIKKKKLNKIM